VVLASAQPATLAQIKAPLEVLHEVSLDINRDGRMDKAVLVRESHPAYTDLWIYLQTGEEALELTRRPSFIKASLTHDPILSVESKSGGSLVIRFGRGGNNHYEMSLTIVHRKGQFWVAGFTKAWDTQQGIGSCDINFLTGRGVAARGLAAARPLKGRFAPIKLVDWSPDRQPRACTR
jgi:hypothetical protein